MSDDLERAARAIAKQSVTAYADDAIWAEDIDLLRRRDARANGNPLDNPIGAARAALLSFLDMDEAGVERIARAIWLDAFAEKIGSPERARYLWDCAEIDGGRDPTQFAAIDSARAVLSELRKMAGEKDG